ncbi:hypothetical protein SISNIDRAFT_494718, partial [Sistotremastrum niveocremeum HHB9708]
LRLRNLDVIEATWILDSVATGRSLPFASYLIHERERPDKTTTSHTVDESANISGSTLVDITHIHANEAYLPKRRNQEHYDASNCKPVTQKAHNYDDGENSFDANAREEQEVLALILPAGDDTLKENDAPPTKSKKIRKKKKRTVPVTQLPAPRTLSASSKSK